MDWKYDVFDDRDIYLSMITYVYSSFIAFELMKGILYVKDSL